MNNQIYLTSQTTKGALIRAIEAEFPHALPNPELLTDFVGRWVLTQPRDGDMIGIVEAGAIMENWFNERKASMS